MNYTFVIDNEIQGDTDMNVDELGTRVCRHLDNLYPDIEFDYVIRTDTDTTASYEEINPTVRRENQGVRDTGLDVDTAINDAFAHVMNTWEPGN